MRHWIVKQEPSAYSWHQFVQDGRTAWTGVRNFQARNHLRLMKKGDRVLFYHSGIGKEVVGVAKVITQAYPDPTAKEGDWDCVDIVPLRPLKQPVSLETIKSHRELRNIALVRQARLSVSPISEKEFETILQLGMTQTKRPAP
jgi:predicted RNA-binding protein with PUA-like domain